MEGRLQAQRRFARMPLGSGSCSIPMLATSPHLNPFHPTLPIPHPSTVVLTIADDVLHCQLRGLLVLLFGSAGANALLPPAMCWHQCRALAASARLPLLTCCARCAPPRPTPCCTRLKLAQQAAAPACLCRAASPAAPGWRRWEPTGLRAGPSLSSTFSELLRCWG